MTPDLKDRNFQLQNFSTLRLPWGETEVTCNTANLKKMTKNSNTTITKTTITTATLSFISTIITIIPMIIVIIDNGLNKRGSEFGSQILEGCGLIRRVRGGGGTLKPP